MQTQEYPEFAETGKFWLNYALNKTLSIPSSTQSSKFVQMTCFF